MQKAERERERERERRENEMHVEFLDVNVFDFAIVAHSIHDIKLNRREKSQKSSQTRFDFLHHRLRVHKLLLLRDVLPFFFARALHQLL